MWTVGLLLKGFDTGKVSGLHFLKHLWSQDFAISEVLIFSPNMEAHEAIFRFFANSKILPLYKKSFTVSLSK